MSNTNVPMGNIVEVNPPDNPGSPGNRNPASLERAFSRSPIYVQNNTVIKNQYEDIDLTVHLKEMKD